MRFQHWDIGHSKHFILSLVSDPLLIIIRSHNQVGYMASIDELKAAIEKLETSAVDIESNAREMFRSARLINTSKGGLVSRQY